MFDVIGIINATYVSLAFPTALLEFVLATWLIVKGFDSNVVNSISEKR